MRQFWLVLISLFGTAWVFAQSPQARISSVFAELDTNGNGSVNEGEFVTACQAMSFRVLDSDSDGAVTRSEWLATEVHAGAGIHFQRLDSNRDDKLSKAELTGGTRAAPWRALFRTLDKDRDGALKRSDFDR